jgi:hypothetical protein
MAGPHRQAPEPEPTQHRTNATLGQGDIELGFDHAGQIHPAPANHAIYGKVWSFANQLCYRRLLLGSEPWFRSSCYAVAEPGDSFGVVAENPVAQGLPVHATELAGFAPLISFKHQGQRQHPPRCIGVIAVCRRLAEFRRRVIVARNCQSYRHQSLRESLLKPQRITPALICKDQLSQSSMPLVLQGIARHAREFRQI